MNHRNLPIALSIDEAAQQANVCRDKVYEAIRRGELKARKAGRRTLILRADLESFLADLPKLELRPTQSVDASGSGPCSVRRVNRGGR